MRFLCAPIVAFGLILAACSDGNAPPPVDPAVAAKAATEARAAKEGALYDQMRQSGSWDVATSLGNEILAKYPDTQTAQRVQQTIAGTRAKSAAIADAHRLAALWNYTVTAEDGGTQYAAAIATREPLKLPNARLRLVLRQHPKWGQSVYLLLDNARFDCKGGCATLPVSFDGARRQHMKATIPPTGEPALFIDDDKGFIAKLEKAKTVAVGVNVKGMGESTVEFDVGGFDPSKLPAKPKN
ncbi:MAG: hypothetical protein ACYC9P_08360 [Rudaea sp.]